MKETVAEQFNQQQLAIARHASNLIERQIAFLRREILLVRKKHLSSPVQPEHYQEAIQETFQRAQEIGVWRIEIIEPESRKDYVFTLFRTALSRNWMRIGQESS